MTSAEPVIPTITLSVAKSDFTCASLDNREKKLPTFCRGRLVFGCREFFLSVCFVIRG
jgi:hypothetical protein